MGNNSLCLLCLMSVYYLPENIPKMRLAAMLCPDPLTLPRVPGWVKEKIKNEGTERESERQRRKEERK